MYFAIGKEIMAMDKVFQLTAWTKPYEYQNDMELILSCFIT